MKLALAKPRRTARSQTVYIGITAGTPPSERLERIQRRRAAAWRDLHLGDEDDDAHPRTKAQGEGSPRRSRRDRGTRRRRPERSRRARLLVHADEHLLEGRRQRLARAPAEREGHLSDPLLHAGDPAPERLPGRPAVLERDGRHPPGAARGDPRRARQRSRRRLLELRRRLVAEQRRQLEWQLRRLELERRLQSSGGGPIGSVIDHFAPSNATTVPLPLLVLGGLAALLMLAGFGTWVARRIQGRRMTPAPAPATSPPTGSPRKPR